MVHSSLFGSAPTHLLASTGVTLAPLMVALHAESSKTNVETRTNLKEFFEVIKIDFLSAHV